VYFHWKHCKCTDSTYLRVIFRLRCRRLRVPLVAES
jgi:hypothetical protein